MRRSRCLVVLFALVLLLQSVSAVPELSVEKIPKVDVVVAELDNEAVFDLVITNNGTIELFRIYSLVGVAIQPQDFFELPNGITTMEIRARPFTSIRDKFRGLFLFDYQIKGMRSGIFEDQMLIRIVELKDVIEIVGSDVEVGDSEVEILVRNKERTQLDNLSVRFKSIFFDFEQAVSLGPEEEISFSVPIAQNISNLKHGPYVITADVKAGDFETRVEGVIRYVESSGTAVQKTTTGFLIRKITVEKINEGNTITRTTIEASRNIITRLFTVHSLEPTITTRAGLIIDYSWEKDVEPGESFYVTTTTNYTFPVVLLLLIILIGFMSREYTRTGVSVKKRVSYVKTKGGEFALKINLRVKAKKAAENIELIDRIPIMTKLFEKFGKKPDRIDEKTRRISWDIGKLNAGEERIFSYIIYSKLRVVGRFELPAATASYITDNRKEVAESNRVYFISETTSTEDGEKDLL